MNKYLLCRPMGGLNDILCRIDNCVSYAKKYHRKLILDTSYSGLLDDISNYFSFEKYNNEITFIKDLETDFFKDKTIYPNFGIEVHQVRQKWSMELGKYVCAKTNMLINFDFEQDYSEDVIVFQQPGGGIQSINLIRDLHFTEEVKNFIGEKIKNLPDEYHAIHIRNSDYKTDYKSFFQTVKEKLKEGENVLVCSDDSSCIDYAKWFFSEKVRVLSIAEIPDTGGKPLHMNKDLDRYKTNLNCLLDLYALSSAKVLHTTNVTKGFPSGFTRLALALNKEKTILKSLIGEE